MAEQQQRKPIPLNALDVMSTWMFAEPIAGGQKRPNFRMKVVGNVPRFVVKTNVPDDKNYGRIDFNCDLPTFAAIFAKLSDIATGKDEGSYTFDFIDHIFVNGQRSAEPLVQASVRIGKDKETGRVYLAVLGHQRPKIQFFFGPSKFHTVKRGDGSELTPAEVSAIYAIGFVQGYAPIIQQLLVTEFSEDAKNVAKPMGAPGAGGQQAGAGGYQQRQGGGGGGYQKSAAPTSKAGDFAEEFDDFSM